MKPFLLFYVIPAIGLLLVVLILVDLGIIE